jgi:uncharacterized protein
MRSWILCLVVMITTNSIFSQTDSVQLETPTGTLYGTLQIPENQTEAVPLVIMHVGSGPTDRDGNNAMMKNNSLRMLADSLEDAFIASLRYDKRGIAASRDAAISETELRFETFVEDLKGWIDAFAEDERFSRIILAGHSEGSLISLLAAIDRPAAVDGWISIAGPARPTPEILRDQLSQQPPMVKDMAFSILDSLEQGKEVTNVNPMLNSLFRPSVQPYLISWFAYDPQEEITKLDMPALIVQGTNDIQVHTDEATLFAEAGGEDVQMILLKNMNHVLKVTEATDQAGQMAVYMNPELPIHPDLTSAIAAFIFALP